MADSTNRVMCELLLQEGVSAALATLYAIESAALFNVLPADPRAAERHNHGSALLAMLDDQLRRIQEQVDALDGIMPAVAEGR